MESLSGKNTASQSTEYSFETLDPRQEALEEVAFVAWQFAASWQRLPFSEEVKPVRPPAPEQWSRATELIAEFQLEAEDIEHEAQSYFKETVEVLFPAEDLEFFQEKLTKRTQEIRRIRARRSIKGAVRKRMLGEE